MMYQRMQQHSQQNSGGNTYVPQRSYGNSNYNSYNSNSYNNNSYNQSTRTYSQPEVEKVIQGVYVYNNQLALVRLRYYSGKITHFSTSRDMMNREQCVCVRDERVLQFVGIIKYSSTIGDTLYRDESKQTARPSRLCPMMVRAEGCLKKPTPP